MKKIILFGFIALSIFILGLLGCKSNPAAATNPSVLTSTITATITITATVSPTVTATATKVCAFAFGNYSATTSAGWNPGFLIASQYTAGSDMIISQLTVKVEGATNYCVGLYSDNAGKPGSVIAWTGVQYASAAGWATAPIPDTQVLNGTLYWIAVETETEMIHGAVGTIPVSTVSYSFATIISSGLPASASWPDPTGSQTYAYAISCN